MDGFMEKGFAGQWSGGLRSKRNSGHVENVQSVQERRTFMKKNKLRLPRVTLAAMTSVKVYETIKALEYSMQELEFGEVDRKSVV